MASHTTFPATLAFLQTASPSMLQARQEAVAFALTGSNMATLKRLQESCDIAADGTISWQRAAKLFAAAPMPKDATQAWEIANTYIDAINTRWQQGTAKAAAAAPDSVPQNLLMRNWLKQHIAEPISETDANGRSRVRYWRCRYRIELRPAIRLHLDEATDAQYEAFVNPINLPTTIAGTYVEVCVTAVGSVGCTIALLPILRMPRTDLWNARTADGKAIYTLPETETAPEDVEYASAAPDFPSLFAPETPVEMPKIAGTLLYRAVDGGYAAFWNALGEEVAACREGEMRRIRPKDGQVPHVGQAGWTRQRIGGKIIYTATVQMYSVIDDIIKSIDGINNLNYYLNKNNLISDINNGFERLIKNSHENVQNYQFKIVFVDTNVIPDLDACATGKCEYLPGERGFGYPTADENFTKINKTDMPKDILGNPVFILLSTPNTPSNRIYIRLGSVKVRKRGVKINKETEELTFGGNGAIVIDKITKETLRDGLEVVQIKGNTYPGGYMTFDKDAVKQGTAKEIYQSRLSANASTTHIAIGFFGIISGGVLTKDPYLYDSDNVIFPIIHELLHVIGLPHPWDTKMFSSLIENEENQDNIRFNVMNSHENDNKRLHLPISEALENMTIQLEQLQFIDENPYIKNV